jgi:MFS family permease
VYRTAEEWTFSEIVHTPKFWLMLVAALGFYVGFTMFLAQGVIHLRDLGYTPAQAAWSFSIMLLSLLGGNLVVAAAGDHIEPRFLWAVASCAFGIGILLALKATGAAGLYLYAIFFGSGFGMAFSATMILPSNYFGQKAYASVVGMMFPIQTTLGALGAFGAGYAYDRFGSYAAAFYTVAVLSLVGAVVALFLTPPARKAAQLPGGHPVAAV